MRTLLLALFLLGCNDASKADADGDTDGQTDADTDAGTADLVAHLHVINLYVADGQSGSSLGVRLKRGLEVDDSVPYFARTVTQDVELASATEDVTFEVFQDGAPATVLASVAAELVTQRSYDLVLLGSKAKGTLTITVLPLPPTDPSPNSAAVRFVHAAANLEGSVDMWLNDESTARAVDIAPGAVSASFQMVPNAGDGDVLTITPTGIAPGADDLVWLNPSPLFTADTHHLVALVHPPKDGAADTSVPVNLVVFDR